MKVLIVDDEKLIREVIIEYLKNEKYSYLEASNGIEAIEQVRKHQDIDIIIMDIMMPKLDGYSAVKEIKKTTNSKIIMLSARSEEFDKLYGFDIGIDDYVTKPFSPKELVARIKAVCKRNINNSNTLKVEGIELNELSHLVYIDKEEIELTHTQFDLLKLFIKNQGIALSREMIIEKIWGYTYEAEDRTIDAHIKLLRNKLGKYKKYIKTVRGVGYKFEYEEK